jgi:hypothetical protein
MLAYMVWHKCQKEGPNVGSGPGRETHLRGSRLVVQGRHDIGDDEGGARQAPAALPQEGRHVVRGRDEHIRQLEPHALMLVYAQAHHVQRSLHGPLRAPEVPPVRLHHRPEPCLSPRPPNLLMRSSMHCCRASKGTVHIMGRELFPTAACIMNKTQTVCKCQFCIDVKSLCSTTAEIRRYVSMDRQISQGGAFMYLHQHLQCHSTPGFNCL